MAFLYAAQAASDSAVVTTAAAWIDELIVTNVSGAARFLHVFDSATLPADTTRPLICLAIPAGVTASWDPAGGRGEKFDNGITLAMSSTADALTVTVASEGVFTVRGRLVY